MAGKRTIRAGLRHFYQGFTFEQFLARHPQLAGRWNLVESRRPEVLVYSCFDGYGKKFIEVHDDCVRLFYTAEAVRPDLERCDFALSFERDLDDPRHLRLPNWAPSLWARGFGPEDLVRRLDEDCDALAAQKTKFCVFAHSNPVEFRDSFVQRLARYKQVDCIGPVLNNHPHVPPQDKLEFIRQYKFVMAFENQEYRGYHTEKLTDALLMRSVPLYWGDPTVDLDFRPESFLWYRPGMSSEDFVERIVALDQDEAAYARMLAEPCYHENSVPEHVRAETVTDWFARVFDSVPERRGFRWPWSRTPQPAD